MNGIDHQYCLQVNTLVHKVEQKYRLVQIQDSTLYVLKFAHSCIHMYVQYIKITFYVTTYKTSV